MTDDTISVTIDRDLAERYVSDPWSFLRSGRDQRVLADALSDVLRPRCAWMTGGLHRADWVVEYAGVKRHVCHDHIKTQLEPYVSVSATLTRIGAPVVTSEGPGK